MSYLLDVNALLALGLQQHEFHQRVAEWLKRERFPEIATCALTELGFVRIATQIGAYAFEIDEAKAFLARLKQGGRLKHRFLTDGHDASYLPGWVQRSKQVTDGHLLALAQAHHAQLATLDTGIPGAVLIQAQ
jgi:toxin-antitoxin system PIN domain toxin